MSALASAGFDWLAYEKRNTVKMLIRMLFLKSYFLTICLHWPSLALAALHMKIQHIVEFMTMILLKSYFFTIRLAGWPMKMQRIADVDSNQFPFMLFFDNMFALAFTGLGWVVYENATHRRC